MNGGNCDPVTISVELDKMIALIGVLEVAKENAEAELQRHDSALGRTTIRNKHIAKMLEDDIELVKAHIRYLRKACNVVDPADYLL